MSTPIELVGLSKWFGKTRAVDDVSLTIEGGKLFFLLGPSGCGKTTLLRLIAGFMEPKAGKIRFGERDVTRLAPNKRNAGMVFQSYALWPHMSVRDNVEFGLKARKVERAERKKRVDRALDAVQMLDKAERKPTQLSGGQQQRVALARALVVEPDVLLLDEPLSNLDAKLRNELREEIRRICRATNVTAVYVTHDQKEALSMADGMAVMSAGKIMQIGGPRELYERPRDRFVADFLGPTNFFEGTIAERNGSGVTVKTSVGALRASSAGDSPTASGAPGGVVHCLVRPESMRLVDGHDAAVEYNTLQTNHLETIYLGEMAQHWLEIRSPSGDAPAQKVRVFEMNPRRTYTPGESVRVSIDPREVVLLRD
jgi:iron(III) transport system ATP-binding protein